MEVRDPQEDEEDIEIYTGDEIDPDVLFEEWLIFQEWLADSVTLSHVVNQRDIIHDFKPMIKSDKVRGVGSLTIMPRG